MLPEESLERAREETADWEEEIEEKIYARGKQIEYGYGGALESDRTLRLPHEIDDQSNCHEQGLFIYSLAKAAGKDPRFLRLQQSGTWHAAVDVESGDGRVLIDPYADTFGPVKYEDQRIEVEDNDLTARTERSFRKVKQLSEEEFMEEAEVLRQDLVSMIEDGQRINADLDISEDVLRTSDMVKINDEERALERTVKADILAGYRDPNAKVLRPFDEEGGLEGRTEVFLDVTGSDWAHTYGEAVLAKRKDGELEVNDSLGSPARENMAKRMKYRELRDGSKFLYDREEREEFIQRKREETRDLKEGPPALHDYVIERLFYGSVLSEAREEDVERERQRRLDWLKFLEEHEVEVPDQEEAAEKVPEYIQIHEEMLEEASGSGEELEKMEEDLEGGLEARKEYEVEEVLGEIEEAGLSETYDEMADCFRELYEADELEREDVRELDRYGALLLVEDGMMDRFDALLCDLQSERDGEIAEFIGDYREATRQTMREVRSQKAQAFIYEWEFSEEEDELRFEMKNTDNMLSPHDSHVVAAFELDELGRLEGRRMEAFDTMEGVDEKYTFLETEVEDFQGIDLEMFQDMAMENMEEVLDRKNLVAPEPHTDRDLLDKNLEYLALSPTAELVQRHQSGNLEELPDELPIYFTEEDLEDFHEKMVRQEEWIRDSEFLRPAWREKARKTLENFGEIEEGSREWYLALEQNRIMGMHLNGQKDEVRDLARERYGSKEEMYREYMTRHHGLLRTGLQNGDGPAIASAMLNRVREGKKMKIPDRDRVREFAEENDFTEILELDRAISEGDQEEALDKLSHLDRMEERIQDDYQRKALRDSMKHFRQRILRGGSVETDLSPSTGMGEEPEKGVDVTAQGDGNQMPEPVDLSDLFSPPATADNSHELQDSELVEKLKEAAEHLDSYRHLGDLSRE
ncbi:MAG: hypothetical protein ABEK01_01350 [Candidatus Nanohaloarchaea archaeon]